MNEKNNKPVNQEYVQSICILEDVAIKLDEIRRKLEENLSTESLTQEDKDMIFALQNMLKQQRTPSQEEDEIVRSGVERTLAGIPFPTHPEDDK